MKLKSKLLILLTTFTFFIPFLTYAYSDSVILGGEIIGIEVNNNGVIVVGSYEVNGTSINSNIEVGDIITKVGSNTISTIEDMLEEIEYNINNNSVNITLIRNNKEIKTTLKVKIDDDGVYKTGLYVKDTIVGIGTLTYIDPETSIYGALGHEIIESYSNTLVSVDSGNIFYARVTGINKSTNSTTGSKEATLDTNVIYGDIAKNTGSGIYGVYEDDIDTSQLIEVAESDEIEIGTAYIYTVLDGEEKDKYEIKIISISNSTDIKNILFEITDEELLEKTGGVIKGMSGSPIVQNNKIIGAVTHAISSKSNMGYGIFITTMLEEGEN